MNKQEILLVAAMLVLATGAAQAEDGQLGATFDLTYASRWMSRGSEVYSEDGAFFETISVDLYGTGLGVAVAHRTATGSGWVDKSRYDYKVFYQNSLFDDKAYKTKYRTTWNYWNWYDRPREIGNTQVLMLALSWPELFGGKLVPKYVAHHDYPAGSGYNNRSSAGWIHLFGLGYKLSVSQAEEPLNLSAVVAYRDGTGGGTKDHDWSHATFGLSTKLGISDKMSFVPGLYHQISMDESVATRDVTYCKLSVKYKF